MIYLDNAATSWPKPEGVYQAVDDCLRHRGGNPGRGGHRLSLQAGRIILETRELLAQLFNITDSARIIFTGNVTEALNLALKGFLRAGDHLILTSMEHNAVVRPAYRLQDTGVEQTIIPCSREGRLDLATLAKNLRANTRLICVNHASNVTGTIQPIEAIGELAASKGIPLLVDCAQTAGILPIDVVKNKISLLAFTGHKGLFGPQGTGGLYIGKEIDLQPLKEGGTGSKSEVFVQPEELPDRFESGTPNTPGIAGLGAGIKFVLQEGLERIRKHEQALTRQIIEGLRRLEGVTRYGPNDLEEQTAVVSLNLEGWEAGELSYVLDQVFDIAVRSGLHCAPLAHATIDTLETGTLRISPGYFNTPAEIEVLLEALYSLVREKTSGRR
ncbi:MAG: aminotransferase class V-fold PLP-dependent enzyme [Syntrophomonadaceae bacterium]|nr:aminotransferase class V-fold PLP-dependent enzyme [Syntrophomonadaceae bacterium]